MDPKNTFLMIEYAGINDARKNRKNSISNTSCNPISGIFSSVAMTLVSNEFHQMKTVTERHGSYHTWNVS